MATKKKTPKLFRVEKPHNAACVARNQGWQTPWCIIDDPKPYVFATFAGNDAGSNPTHYWLRIRCNDTGCNAILRVHIGNVLVALNAPDTRPLSTPVPK